MHWCGLRRAHLVLEGFVEHLEREHIVTGGLSVDSRDEETYGRIRQGWTAMSDYGPGMQVYCTHCVMEGSVAGSVGD